MQVHALIAIGAEERARVVDTFLHLAQIVFVREITTFTLFAETSQPVLAY